MPTINQLPLVTQVSGGNQVVLWVSDQGDSRRASITTLIEYIEANFGNVVCTTVRTTASTFAQLRPYRPSVRPLQAAVQIRFPFGATAPTGWWGEER